MELVMHERNQPREGGFVAMPPRLQQAGNVRRLLRNAAILGLFPTVHALAAVSRFLIRRGRP
jgi:hypothetical protein